MAAPIPLVPPVTTAVVPGGNDQRCAAGERRDDGGAMDEEELALSRSTPGYQLAIVVSCATLRAFCLCGIQRKVGGNG